jgi:hypothetical protein
MDDFERELESELHRILDPMTAAPVPARRAVDSRGTMKKLLGGVGAAIGVKLLTGIAVAAAAATVAAAATEVATTGSINPSDWGRQVSQQVQTCKDTLRASGTRGIGQCVSQFATQHGKPVSNAHAIDARGNGNGNGNGNANGHAKDKTKSNGNGNGSSSSKDPQGSAGEPTDPVTIPTHPVITPQP